MRIPYFQINAFTGKNFKGNPAGVCLLEKELDAQVMQNIATENNLSETAFVLNSSGQYSIRWFTPATEVDLCGHATLASAYAILNQTDYPHSSIQFESKSGLLQVSKEGELYKMDFPSDKIKTVELPDKIKNAFTRLPIEEYRGLTDFLLIFENEKFLKDEKPNLKLLAECEGRGVIISAPGKEVDFVSRFFAPQSGIPEDPVTGSAHTTLIPYWSKRLGKINLLANQLSERGGELHCTFLDDRVEIAGNAELYISGYIFY